MPEEQLPRKTQLSIRDFMLGIGILSWFLAIAAFMGFGNGFLIICAVASGFLSCVFTVTAPRKKFGCTTWTTVAMALLLCNPMLMFFSVVMAANCIGHWILILTTKRAEPPITTLKALYRSAVVALIAFCVGVAIGLPGYFEFKKNLKQFEPIEIASRLVYESEFDSEQPSIVDFTTGANYRNVELRFDLWQRESSRFFGRTWALEGIHRHRAEQFAKSPGFGVARMFPPTIERAIPPPKQSIEFDELVELSHRHFKRHDFFSSNYASQVHEASLFDFVHPDGFGLKVGPRQYRGFVPHAFYQSPVEFDPTGTGLLKLEKLQLISLRRFDTPLAYDLDYLPRMDHLDSDDIATRKLSQFELDALKTLQERTDQLPEGEDDPPISDVVLLEGEQRIEMVGAIRAINSCLECHNAKQHEMLGAFTYQFHQSDAPEEQ